MHEPVLVCRLEATARLREDFDDAIDSQPMTGSLDELIQRLSRKKRHHEERLPMPPIVELPDVEDFDDVRMADRLEGGAFLVEQLEGEWIGELVQCLDRDLAVQGRRIVGAKDHAHPALSQLVCDLVAPCDRGHVTPGRHFNGLYPVKEY